MLKKIILSLAFLHIGCASGAITKGDGPNIGSPVRQSVDPALRKSLEDCISNCNKNEKTVATAILNMLLVTVGTADSKAVIEPLAKLVSESLNRSRPGASKEEIRGIYEFMNHTRDYMKWFSDELERQQKNAPAKT